MHICDILVLKGTIIPLFLLTNLGPRVQHTETCKSGTYA
jgi:hypothetical protein